MAEEIRWEEAMLEELGRAVTYPATPDLRARRETWRPLLVAALDGAVRAGDDGGIESGRGLIDDRAVAIDLDGVVNGGQLVRWKLDVHDCADDLNDFSCCAFSHLSLLNANAS